VDAPKISEHGWAPKPEPFPPIMVSNVVVQLADRMRLLAVAREMLSRDGPKASLIARDRAEHEAGLGDLRSAAAWRIIADAIDHEASE
jgi:hypothetical protein